MIETPQALPAGTRLGDGGRYEIQQRIGVGGMAEVYKAVDTRLGNRVVAVKTLSANVAEHPFAAKMRSLFIQEAQALSRVNDENVVDVLDFGTGADGAPYMVMEFLHGTDLGVFLKKTKQVAVETAVDVMLGVCAGVHACHLAGIIHRDLKPANIFLSRTLKGEQPKVLDFSVAKVPIARPAVDPDQMRTDLIVGTPSYMSPEQALGRPANELSDQYSIGALLYRCLTGRPPQGILPGPREMRADIPAPLEEIILRALDPTPHKRFASVHELGHALVTFASSTGRGRWKAYYRTPPRPIDLTSSGPISADSAQNVRSTLGVEPASAPSLPPTAAAPAYDFKLHDRTTTSLGPDGEPAKGAESATSTKSTMVDCAPGTESSSTGGSRLPTSAEVPISVVASAVGGRLPSGISGAARSSRRRIVAVLGACAALVIGVTAIGIRLAHHTDVPTSPRAPEWTRTTKTLPVPEVAPASPPASASPAAGGGPVPPVESASERAEPARDQSPSARARKAKRRRAQVPSADTIQYAPDGLPILH